MTPYLITGAIVIGGWALVFLAAYFVGREASR